jgi:hypothetical protein
LPKKWLGANPKKWPKSAAYPFPHWIHYTIEKPYLWGYIIYIYICTYVYIHICIYIQSYRVHLVRLASTPIFMLAPIPLSCFKS